MGTVDVKFRSAKLDQSPYLFHFTKGMIMDAKKSMLSIIDDQEIRSKNGYISFTASPITSLRSFFKTRAYRTGLPMYQPIGIGFSRDILVKNCGARNVIYCGRYEMQDIPDKLKWRSEVLEVGEYDFEYLREWRICGKCFNFSQFPKEHILIVAPTEQELNTLVFKHDIIFKPIVDPYEGETDLDLDEVFIRNYKGLTLLETNEAEDDYAVSASTISQILGEDMCEKILPNSCLYVSGLKNSNKSRG